MRLLFLTPYVPSPPSSGGAMRMHGLLSNLAQRHEIALLTFADHRRDVTESVEATGRYARLIVTVANPAVGVAESRRRIGQLRSLFSRRSYEWRTHARPAMQRTLERVCDEWRPDAIVVEFAQMGFFDVPAGIPVILDAHNIEHEIVQRTAAVEGSPARRLYGRVNGRKLRREELALVRRVGALAVTSERDREVFARLLPGVQPVVIPNGVDCDRFRPSSRASEEPSLLFFGALDYYPNVDAVLYFYDRIWPRLTARHPELKLTLVGRKPPDAIRSLGDDPRVTVTGLVEDVRPWIAGASVVVVPLRAGSGTRLKILEALAMAKSVVSTSLGVEGLAVVDGEHLLIADDPDRFTHAVSSLLASEAERQRIADAGRKLVERRYDWREVAACFEQLIAATVQARQR